MPILHLYLLSCAGDDCLKLKLKAEETAGIVKHHSSAAHRSVTWSSRISSMFVPLCSSVCLILLQIVLMTMLYVFMWCMCDCGTAAKKTPPYDTLKSMSAIAKLFSRAEARCGVEA